MLVRNATIADLPTVYRMAWDGYKELKDVAPEAVDPDLLWNWVLKAHTQAPQVLLEKDGEIIGFWGLCTVRAAWSYDYVLADYMFYILPEHRSMKATKQLKDAVRLSSNLSIQAGSSGGSSQYGISSRSSVNNTRNGRLNQLEEINRQLDSTKALLARDPIEQYKQTLAQIQNNGLVNSSGSAPASTPMALVDDSQASNTNGAYNQFDGQNSRWDLNSKVEKPKSPFQLHAGFVIPALMITGVNSDLAGQIMGQVSQNVYDSVTGEHLLIPQGSRLVGTYNSKVAFGQERVMVAWQRILFPDGKSMDIGSMQGADSAGYSGFKDLVNHHFWRVFGSAIMMSVITAAAELSQDDDNDDSNKERSALNEALGQQLGQAAAQMIMRNLNIAPTIEVRSGYRFNVMVSKDMVFTRPYQSYDY